MYFNYICNNLRFKLNKICITELLKCRNLQVYRYILLHYKAMDNLNVDIQNMP